MRKRTAEQLECSTEIYRKHANKFISSSYPKHRFNRMAIYTNLITEAKEHTDNAARTISRSV